MQGSNVTSCPPQMIMKQMEAGAFRELCQHLRERSDEVQNIDLMTLSGFCRNCLAKWMVLEARELSKTLIAGRPSDFHFLSDEEKSSLIQQLDCFGYDEAAQDVYGCTYSDWKKRHQTKATENQIRLYKASTPIHASHNEDILKTKSTPTYIGSCQIHLSKDILSHLHSGAFRSLCQHLRERSDEVQNIDLMGLSGFCRNCLAKWLVIQARKISDEIQDEPMVNILDAYNYDKAARAVYGCEYEDWKKRHQKKATAEQIKRFNSSKDLHAIHNKDLLTPRIVSVSHNQDDSTNDFATSATCMREPSQKLPLLSNVCCEDVDAVFSPEQGTKQSGELPLPSGSIKLRIAVLTISDRAAANAYANGDMSGPAVKETIVRQTDEVNSYAGYQKVTVSHVETAIVPDEFSEIEKVLLEWSGKTHSGTSYDMIFTTGGTGFSKRDVTPEATLAVLERECRGLMSWASLQLTAKQPLATLSRAAAGICGNSIIVNLPGNPSGASEVLGLLFPLLLHAVRDFSP